MAQRHGAHERDARGGSTGGGHGAHRRPGDGEFGAHETGDDDFGDWFDSWDLESEDSEPARPRRRRDEKRTRKSAKPHGASWGPKTSSKHAQAGDGKLAAFAQEYGWRAYAIPVLAVITVFVLINMFQNPEDLAVGSTASSAEELSLIHI